MSDGAPRKTVLDPMSLEPRIGTGYPAPYDAIALNREKRAMGDAFGLSQFGVNLAHLPPGEASSQRHWQSGTQEFVYILEGEATLITDAGEQVLGAGMAMGFPAGVADGHHLVNKSDATVTYLEIGTRDARVICSYPDIDLHRGLVDGEGRFTRKDGSSFEDPS